MFKSVSPFLSEKSVYTILISILFSNKSCGGNFLSINIDDFHSYNHSFLVIW